MAVWKLEAGIDFTTFSFVLEGDKAFFQGLVKDYFDESKPVSAAWRPLYMRRDEPMKHPDFFEVDGTDVLAASERAVDCLKDFLNAKTELLPIRTDAGPYYVLNVLNFVDCLDRKASAYTATPDGTIVSYSELEFDEEKLEGHGLFKIPQLPYVTFISSDIQEQCEQDGLEGLVFDTESNLAWYED
jgi:hypothetical protein